LPFNHNTEVAEIELPEEKSHEELLATHNRMTTAFVWSLALTGVMCLVFGGLVVSLDRNNRVLELKLENSRKNEEVAKKGYENIMRSYRQLMKLVQMVPNETILRQYKLDNDLNWICRPAAPVVAKPQPVQKR